MSLTDETRVTVSGLAVAVLMDHIVMEEFAAIVWEREGNLPLSGIQSK